MRIGLLRTLLSLAALSLPIPRLLPAGAERALLVRAERVYTVAHGILAPGEILVRDGKIAKVGTGLQAPAGSDVLQAKVVIPGLVDMHTHLGVYSLPRVDEN